MKKTAALSALVALFCTAAIAQNYEWAKSIGNTSDDWTRGIATDDSGNVYVTGSFQLTADFDPGVGTQNLTSVGSYDIFFAKYDSSGNYLWAKSIGSASTDEGRSIAVDTSGNVYITGYFQDTADFDPGAGTANLTPVGINNVFFAKYDNSGNYLWAKSIGSASGYDQGYSIAVDGLGNVYLTGEFTGTADYDPGAGTANLTVVGAADIFFAKYDNSGNYLWAKSIGSIGNDFGHSIALDGAGNVYVTGFFSDTADFDPGAGSAALTSQGGEDIFFAKYDSIGNYLWAKNIGSTSNDRGYGIAVDVSGNAYITGEFQGSADFDPGAGTANLTAVDSTDIFFAKYDSGGNYLWAKNIGSTSNDRGYGIATDTSDNVYITGYFYGTADFDPGPGTQNLTAAGRNDIFFAKYDASGNYLWAKNIGSTSKNDEGFGIATDNNDNVYVAGYFRDTADFDPGPGTQNLTAAGNSDIFFAKYSQPPPPCNGIIYTDTIAQILHDGINCIDYPIVKIGSQWWMQENVNATLYSDSTQLVDGTGAGNITGNDTTKYYFNYNDSAAYSDTYGKFYTWAAAMNGAASSDSIPSGVQGVCPNGWHLPSDSEWKQLEMGLGMSQASADATSWRGTDEGDKLKDNIEWNGTNTSGFSAFPGGERAPNGSFMSLGSYGYWWNSTDSGSTNAWDRSLYDLDSRIARTNNSKAEGFSCRCVKDFLLPLTVSISNVTNVSCNGGSDGTATATATGGTTPYTYSWSTNPVQTNSIATGLAAGTYYITVTDAASDSVIDSANVSEPGSWTQKANFGLAGSERSSASGFSIGTKGYIGTGQDAGGAGTVDFWEYNPSADVWSQKANVGGSPRWNAVGFSIDGKGYIGTGSDGSVAFYDIWEYDPAGNTWTQKASLNWRQGAVGFSIGTKGYVGTGQDAGGARMIDFWEYDPSADMWTQKADFGGTARDEAMGFSIGTKGYIGTGYDGANKQDFWEYDPSTDAWTQKASLANTVKSAVGFSIGAKGYIGTGEDGLYTTDFLEYDPGADIWTQKANFSGTGRYEAVGFAISGKAYIGTGNDGVVRNDFWEYTPTTLSLSLSTSSINATCNGSNNGSAVASPTGTSPYSYLWSTSDTSDSISGLSAGIYIVTVTDNSGCTASDTATITEPLLLQVQITTIATSCNGACDGIATATVIGGTSPYTYSWASGTSTNTNMCAGSYPMTVTDANNCTASPTYTVNEPAAIIATISGTDASCAGVCDAAATVTSTGGTGVHTYLWDDPLGQTTATATGLCGGPGNTYQVTVTDANACAIVGAHIALEPAPVVVSTSTTDATCSNSDGSATATATGGDSAYFYQWDDINAQITATANNLAAGTYMVVVADGVGCTDTAFATVNDLGGPSGTLGSAPASCGGSDGTATVTASGPNGPFTYLWSDPGTQSTLTATGLAAGVYSVIVTDTNGCIFTDTVSVGGGQPPAAVIDSSTDVSCFAASDGSAAASASGGTAPYTYSWNDPSSQTNAIATGLGAGSYMVIISDANGCLDSAPITIAEPALLTATASGSDPVCNGVNDGSAAASAGGGATPYSYSWNDPSNQTTATATGLGGGTYTVIVTDSNACSNSAMVTLSTPPPAIATNATVLDETGCQGDGIILLSVSGGVSPYTYIWNTGNTTANLNGLSVGQYVVTVTDSSGCIAGDTIAVNGDLPPTTLITGFDETACGAEDGIATLAVTGGAAPYTYNWSNGAATQNLAGLSGGIYTVEVTDSVGCIAHDTVTISEPEAPSMNVTGFDESACNADDGAAVAVVSGGTAPYTYNWSNGATTQSVSGLAPGSYVLTVTGADGCTASDAVIINAAPGPSIGGMTGIDESSCGASDGAIVLSVSGGQTPYTFNWSTGATTQNLTGISSGTYAITLSDANGCTDAGSVTLTSLGSIVLGITTSDANCGDNDGSATVTVSGGTPPYSYGWTSGDTTAFADSLTSGIYIATVEDAGGCSNSIAATISDVGGAVVSVGVLTEVSCNGGSDGAIDIDVTGGVAPYTYTWSNGAASEDISGVAAGPYEINLTDGNGCVSSKSIIVSQPTALVLTTNSSDANCGSSDGSVNVGVTGGTGNYTYAWPGGGTDSVDTGLSAGVYMVTVTDANACAATASAAVSNIGGPVIVTDIIEDADCDDPVGSIYISITGGTAPYVYAWSDLSNNQDLVGVAAGSYSVTVTDSSGCAASAGFDISGIPPTFEPICMVTVDTVTGRNLVVWEKTQVQGVSSYNIYKESTQQGVYFKIGNVAVDSLSVFVDSVSDPTIRSWRYKISVVNSCGYESDLSQDHKTMHLTINLGINNWINLIWDHYKGFSYASYYIERFTTSTGWQTIDSIPANLTSYTDQNTPEFGQLFYQVSVKHPDGCLAEKSKNFNSSKSNTSSYNAGSPEAMTSSTATSDAGFGLCDGTATVSVSGGVEPYTYLWGDSLAQTDSTATGLCPGPYEVTVFDSNGDSVSASVVIGTLPGIEEKDLSGYVQVFPNPNLGVFNVRFSGAVMLESLSVYNAMGEYIKGIHDNLKGAYTMDLSDYPAGVYHLRIVALSGVANKKVIIH